MQLEDCFNLGFIAKPHGIRGEVKAVFDVDNINAYKKKASIFYERSGKLTLLHLKKFSIQSKKDAILAFEEIKDREGAEMLKGSSLYLPLEDLPPLTGFKFYYHEVIGFTVVDEIMGEIGSVTGYKEMPAQDLLIMDHNGFEVLIPVTDDFVMAPDRENKILPTRLPNGLVDIYLEEKKNKED